jgi:hypothetical protein
LQRTRVQNFRYLVRALERNKSKEALRDEKVLGDTQQTGGRDRRRDCRRFR